MSNRAGKSGDAFEVQKKMEMKYDMEEQAGTPAKIVGWITAVMGDEIPKAGGTDYHSIHVWLKDGTVLCKLINKLLLAAGLPKVGMKAKATMTFAAMENLGNFNTGCRNYGVQESALFQSSDCYEGRKGLMLNVVNCLNQLGFTANTKKYSPSYEAVDAPKADY